MQIMIKLLKVKYGPEATSMLRNNKHTGIETNTMRRWFYHSLSKQLFHLLLNNGMMSSSCLHTELPEIMEQGRVSPKLQMVILQHIKYKPIGSNASPLIKIIGKAYQPVKPKNQDVEEAVDCGVLIPMVPLFPSICRTGRDTTTSRLLATGTSLNPTLLERPLGQGGTTRLQQRPLLHNETEPSPWLGLATSLRGKRLRQTFG